MTFWIALTLIIALIVGLGFLYFAGGPPFGAAVDPSCPPGTEYVLSETKWICK